MRFGCVYKIENRLNGKVYIGRTIRNPATRFREHCRPKLKKWNKSLINDAIQLHGPDMFVFEVLKDGVPECDLDAVEEGYIEQYGCMAPAGYNCIKRYTTLEVSPTTRAKMSKAKVGKPPWNAGKTGSQAAWNKGKYNLTGCKPVVAVSIATGEKHYYPSAAEAVRQGFNSGHVTQCCRGKLKHHKGYYWSYNKETPSE